MSQPGYRFELALADTEVWDVYADPAKIGQVVRNLLSNTVKYSEPGSQVRVRERVEDGSYLATVEDNDIGMTSEELDRIFERFYRADAAELRAPGMGFGMSISPAIVRAHGGDIRAESCYGMGTRVSFPIPRQQPIKG